MSPRDVHLTPTLENQIPPNRGYPYFAARSDHPFLPEADEFQLANAGWLVDASMLAYAAGESGVLRALGEAGLDPPPFSVDVFSGPSTQCVALKASPPGFVIVAFRGTRLDLMPDPIETLREVLTGRGDEPPPPDELVAVNWADVLTDADIRPGRDGIHRGFSRGLAQLDEVVPPLQDYLGEARDTPVWFTGHSLGAALATLAAFRMRARNPQGLYTFG